MSDTDDETHCPLPRHPSRLREALMEIVVTVAQEDLVSGRTPVAVTDERDDYLDACRCPGTCEWKGPSPMPHERAYPLLALLAVAQVLSGCTAGRELQPATSTPPSTRTALPVHGPHMDVVRGSLPPGYQAVAPTPGVALVRLCRIEGSRQAPRVTLLQSSGDASFDERILGRRGVISLDEPSGIETCSLISALRSDPATPAPTFDESAPPPPPPPPPPDSIAPMALEAIRVAGDKNIFPSDLVKVEISRSNKRQITVPVKVCLDREGRVATVKVLLSSGYMAYDADLINAIAAWRYLPVMVDGKPSPVCSAIQFIYRQNG